MRVMAKREWLTFWNTCFLSQAKNLLILKKQLQYRQTLLGLDNYLAFQISDYMKDGRDLDEFTDFENKTKALSLFTGIDNRAAQ